MVDHKSIIKVNVEELEIGTSELLKKEMTNLIAGLAGITSSKKQEIILSIGFIFQKLRGGKFLSALLEEWNKYVEKGLVKEDYQNTEQHQACLQEMLDSLDKDIPDEIRFSYLKKIFFVTASEKCYSRESNLPQQFMKICRTLSSGEIIVLNACYRICQKNWQKEHNFQSASEWVKIIANISDLKYTALVEIHEQELIEKRLISRRIHGDRSGVVLQPYFRLTDLGYEICSYIEKYEEIEK